MVHKYEYTFVRLGENKNFLGGHATVSDEAQRTYQSVVHKYARDGWRLVQIFAPGLAVDGDAVYYELIFEREL